MGRIQLTTERGDQTANAAVMIARLKGSAATEPTDQAELDAFCDRLKGHTFRSYLDVRANPDDTPLPCGYRNVRVRDRRDGALIGSIWWVGSAAAPILHGADFRTVTERPSARRIIAMCLFMPFEEVTAWRSTLAAPSGEPGTLDLVVDIDTRPRELLMVDGSPLPPDIVAFIASQAPARARRGGLPPRRPNAAPCSR